MSDSNDGQYHHTHARCVMTLAASKGNRESFAPALFKMCSDLEFIATNEARLILKLAKQAMGKPARAVLAVSDSCLRL